MAVLSHTIPGPLGSTGSAGVDVFFVISGFIIYRVSQGREPGAFLRDRAIRVLPLWWIMAVPWVGIAAKLHQLTPQMLAATVTLWPVYDVAALPALRPGWSLEFEILFYLAMAFGLAVPRLRRWLPAIWVACFAGALLTHWPLLQYLGNPMVVEFFAGVLIARSAFRSRWLGAAAIVLAVAAYAWFAVRGTGNLEDTLSLFQMTNRWRWIEWGAPAVALVWGALQFEGIFQARAWGPLVYLGDASYSIYLSNFLTVLFLLNRMPGWLLWAVCIGVGTLVYRYVEVPILGFIRAPISAQFAKEARSAPPRPV